MNFLKKLLKAARDEVSTWPEWEQKCSSSSRSPDGYVEKPRRRVELVVSIGADDWDETAAVLEAIAERIYREGPITTLVSGGYSSGYSVTGTEQTEQTGDNYRRQNEEYVKSLRTT